MNTDKIEVIEDFEKIKFSPYDWVIGEYTSRCPKEDYKFAVYNYFGQGKPGYRRIYDCRMNWTRQDAEKLAKEFEVLYNGILEIARVSEALPQDPADYGKMLSRDLCELYERYLSDFESTVEEKDLQKRVGPGPLADKLILYARRLFYLAKKGEPAVLIIDQAKTLARFMCAHRFAEQVWEY